MHVHILSQFNLSEDRDDFHFFSEFMVSQKLGGIVNIKGFEVQKDHNNLKGCTESDRMKITGSIINTLSWVQKPYCTSSGGRQVILHWRNNVAITMQ